MIVSRWCCYLALSRHRRVKSALRRFWVWSPGVAVHVLSVLLLSLWALPQSKICRIIWDSDFVQTSMLPLGCLKYWGAGSKHGLLWRVLSARASGVRWSTSFDWARNQVDCQVSESHPPLLLCIHSAKTWMQITWHILTLCRWTKAVRFTIRSVTFSNSIPHRVSSPEWALTPRFSFSAGHLSCRSIAFKLLIKILLGSSIDSAVQTAVSQRFLPRDMSSMGVSPPSWAQTRVPSCRSIFHPVNAGLQISATRSRREVCQLTSGDLCYRSAGDL